MASKSESEKPAFPMQVLPEPDSPLGWHRQLAPVAGVKVSPLCLGGMNLGVYLLVVSQGSI